MANIGSMCYMEEIETIVCVYIHIHHQRKRRWPLMPDRHRYRQEEMPILDLGLQKEIAIFKKEFSFLIESFK